MKSNVIVNANPSYGYNYQLLRNDVLDLETDTRITSYSLLVSVIKRNRVIQSAYACDIARDVATAKALFLKVASGNIGCESLREYLEEFLE